AGNPELATKAVMVSGVFNIAGDYFCVFVLDMGIMGAGLATGVSSVLSLLVMLTHFRSKRCTIHFAKPRGLARMLKDIAVTGFATFFTDVAMGILTILFNHQVLKYLGSEALSIYGVIINVSTFVQCCAYSVGQASQPIISANFGAGRGGRIRQVLNYASVTALLFGLFWVLLSLFAPNLYVRIFMSPTESILAAAPAVIRVYGISFLLLPFNIFSTYYFQALIQPRTSFVVSVARGAVLSGILIYLLPALFAPAALWFAMPVTELAVAIYAAVRMMQFTNRLPDITA
ncbi:MAG: multidrug transporter MatE, partial [Oscillospiraceae bacterium]|nr:multidrug transporter MatE [Oscillospiraceae bacterium]